MLLEYYIDFDGTFYPERFFNYLVSTFKLVNSPHKPYYALLLKETIEMDEKGIGRGLPKLKPSEKECYYNLLRAAEGLYGELDKHLTDCVGKQVRFDYLLPKEKSTLGIIVDYLSSDATELHILDKKIGMPNIGYRIKTKEGEKTFASIQLSGACIIDMQ